jgi:hypothetical protein
MLRKKIDPESQFYALRGWIPAYDDLMKWVLPAEKGRKWVRIFCFAKYLIRNWGGGIRLYGINFDEAFGFIKYSLNIINLIWVNI